MACLLKTAEDRAEPSLELLEPVFHHRDPQQYRTNVANVRDPCYEY